MGALIPPIPTFAVTDDATCGDIVADCRLGIVAAGHIHAVSQSRSVFALAQALVLLGQANAQKLACCVFRACRIDTSEGATADGWHEVFDTHGHQSRVVEAHRTTYVPSAVGDRNVSTIPEFLRRGRLRSARISGHIVPPQDAIACLDALGDGVVHGVLIRYEVALPIQDWARVARRNRLAQLTFDKRLPPPAALVAIGAAVGAV